MVIMIIIHKYSLSVHPAFSLCLAKQREDKKKKTPLNEFDFYIRDKSDFGTNSFLSTKILSRLTSQ